MPPRQKTDVAGLVEGFGERLTALRLAYVERDGEREHTMAQWARRLHKSKAMYGRWEAGANLPKYEDLFMICELYRIDPNYLIAGVLSRSLRPWLLRALEASNPELQREAGFWRNRTERYQQASQALAGGERTNTEPPKPPVVVGSKRKTPKRRK